MLSSFCFIRIFRKRKRWKSLSTTPTRTFPRIKVTPLQEITDIVPNLDSRRKWVSRKNLKNLSSPPSAPRPHSTPPPPQNPPKPLILRPIVGPVPNSSGERGMGNGERESWQKNFLPTPISRLARPSPPPRGARQDLPALLKPANHTLAFSRGISAESSFVNAKHFQPRSFSDAPTRYKVYWVAD